MSSQSSYHPQEVLLAQFSLYVHKGGLKPDSFHFISFINSFKLFILFHLLELLMAYLSIHSNEVVHLVWYLVTVLYCLDSYIVYSQHSVIIFPSRPERNVNCPVIHRSAGYKLYSETLPQCPVGKVSHNTLRSNRGGIN